MTTPLRAPESVDGRGALARLAVYPFARNFCTRVFVVGLLSVAGFGSGAWAQLAELDAVAETPPQREMARVIGIICPEGNLDERLQADCDAVVGAALQGGDQATEAGIAVAELTADQARTPSDASQNSVAVQARNVRDRLAALRAGATGVSVGGVAIHVASRAASASELARLQLASTGEAASRDGFALVQPWGIFLNGTVSFGDKDGTPNQEGFDFDTQGVTLGADYRFTPSLVAGVAIGYVNGDTDLDENGGELDTNGYSITLFGTYYVDSFYTDVSVSYGRNDYDQQRNITYTLTEQNADVDQSLSADFNGNQWHLALNGGYEMRRNGWTFGPTARLEYVTAGVDGYDEKASNPDADGGGWTVRLDDQEFDSLTLSLGGRAAFIWNQSWGVLQPLVTAEWVHEFDDDGELITGRFIGDSNREEFRLPTDETDTDYFNVGIGASAVFAGGLQAFVFYEKLLGFQDLDLDTVNAGLRWEF